MPSEYANDLMSRVGLDTTEWKKGISELNAGLKHIETGFQASAAIMDDWSNNTDGLRKRIESLNDKLAIQKQKLDILKKAYEEEVAENGESSKAAEQLAKKMYQVKNEIERTSDSINSYTKKLDGMSLSADKVSKKLGELSSKTRTLSTASAGMLGIFGAGIVKAGQNADELNTLAKQTGLTVEEIQKFKYASDLIDVELDDMTGALRKMTKNMISTSSEVKGAWETLGVSTTDANGKAKDAVDTFYEVLNALSNVRNETERDQLAMLIFGKSANDLAGIVDDGGAALRRLGDEAENLGLIMSQDVVDGANEFNDVLDQMKAKVTASFSKGFSENAERLVPAMESMAESIVDVVSAISQMPPWATKTSIGILAISSAISPVLSVGGKMVSLFGKIKKSKLGEHLTGVARSLRSTGDAGKAAASGISSIGTAASIATPILLGLVAILGVVMHYYEKTKNEMKAIINETYDAEIEKAKETYGTEIALLNEKLDAVDSAYYEEKSLVENSYNSRIKAAEDYVKTTKKELEELRKTEEKNHKESLKRIEEESEARKKAVDDRVNQANSLLQSQIDKIDAQIEAEEKARKEAQAAEKRKALEDAVANASSLTERRNAEKELAEFIVEQETEKTSVAREELKKQLQDQIEANNKKAENEKNLIDAETNAKKAAIDKQYEDFKEGLDKRLESLDNHITVETEKAKLALDNALNIANEKYKEDTANFTAQLKQKEKEYENHLKKLEADRDKATSEIVPDVDDVWDTAKSDIIWGNLYNNGKYLSEMSKAAAMNYFNYLENPDAVLGFGQGMIASDEYSDSEIKKIKDKINKVVGKNAVGTDFWRGGLTRINEEGGEILNLPRGTQIIPHDVSIAAVKEYARQKAAETQPSVTNTYNNTYGPQQRVTQVNISGHNVATIIEPNVSEIQAIKLNQRRRAGNVYR